MPRREGRAEPDPPTIGTTIVAGLIGAVFGAAVSSAAGPYDAGIWLGLGLGVVAGRLWVERARVNAQSAALEAIEQRLARLEQSVAEDASDALAAPRPTPPPAPPDPDATSEPIDPNADSPWAGATSVPATPGSRAIGASASGSSDPRPVARPTLSAGPPSTPPPPNAFDRAMAGARGFLFGGNTVVRGGVLVLLVGVTLLARWAAENALLSIEARLAIAALIGLGLVCVGFLLRTNRPGFGTTLQGGGLAALYLVAFIAFRFYGLIPTSLAFGLFVVLAAASGALAVLQRALPLIVIASLGGFLAPILASTGSGDHVALFGYYLVLNVSIAAIAFARSWRVLNLLAFVCTYGVATTWGVLSYTPEHRASTLPFVFAFMLVFTGEALLFAWRQPPRLRGLVDGTLVFGTPLVTLLTLGRLLGEVEMGLAFATSGMAIFYAAIALWLWRTAPETLRQLSEAFVALAIGLGTMAVPFAFEDSPTTAIVWALEGAGIHWVGVRQSRRLARVTGIALQPLAAIAFAISLASSHEPPTLWLANGRYLSAVALAFAGLAIAREADRAGRSPHAVLWAAAQAAGVWGIGWWAWGQLHEVRDFVPHPYGMAVCAVLVGASAAALCGLASKLAWTSGRVMSLLGIPAAAWVLLMAHDSGLTVLEGLGFAAWPLCLYALYRVVAQLEALDDPRPALAYAPWLWLCAAVASFALFGLADAGASLGEDWRIAGIGFGLGGVAALSLGLIQRERSGLGRFPRVAFSFGVGPILGVGLCWIALSSLLAEGETGPLPYVPLINPTDIGVGLIAIAATVWCFRLPAVESEAVAAHSRPAMLALAAILAFGWLNAVLVRSVVQWADVPHRADALWDSTPLQVCLSIAWTLVGFAGMWTSTRKHLRRAWMLFAGLLAVTVVKLFVVDLSQLTTPAKIGTFLVVGVLLLIVGYLSPVPPDTASETPGSDAAVSGRTSGSLIVWLALCALAAQLAPLPVWAGDEAPLEMNDFAWGRGIESTRPGVLQVIDLPISIYRDSIEPGLADLRVFDSQGKPVPHAIARPRAKAAPEPELIALPVYRLPQGASASTILRGGSEERYRIDIGVGDVRTTLQVEPEASDAAGADVPHAYLVDTSGIDAEIVGLEFDLAPQSEDFLVPLRIESTDDLVRYRVVAGAVAIAQLAGSAKAIERRRVLFDATQADYLRITWPAGARAPVIVGASAVRRTPHAELERQTARAQTEVLAPDSYVADLGGGVPIDRVQIDIGGDDRLVAATVYLGDDRAGPWRAVHHGLVYRLAREGAEASRNPAITLRRDHTRFVRVDIDGERGGAGLDPPVIEVGWPTEQLYFIDQGGAPYSLAYGRRGAPAARFDARALREAVAEMAETDTPLPSTATLGARFELAGPQAMAPDPTPMRRRMALWAVLLVAVAIVAAMAVHLLREMRK